jgi:hypothetical protein
MSGESMVKVSTSRLSAAVILSSPSAQPELVASSEHSTPSRLVALRSLSGFMSKKLTPLAEGV